ncbi:uracil-DNA glycosylase [Patiriisocius marinus]|uniref:Uracil-DNA glycosylase n=1 Tax=Patiriisocius marinus TaxID=1397112 RepID=A0A5J4IP69_9FLAO|nr:uracil-DNA glycosylase [Patiriisocius marinus]GER59445.1 uracil-DNA glycosylase 2 [Patiriisocius marinus]
MDVKMGPQWEAVLEDEIQKDYFKSLVETIESEYRLNTCYPPSNSIFSAFEYTPFNDIKVVIIGQDPYHGRGQANGLCFSVTDGITHPPSLKNIFKEIVSDIGIAYPESGNLERWAKQGVLLLNATLTVKEAAAGSHQKIGWETFTDAVIKKISEKRTDVVFLLWGGFAKKKAKLIDGNKHHILLSGHPSPLSANRGYWFGNQHFSKTNSFLASKGNSLIDWK